MLAGAVPNLLYCFWLPTMNRTGRQFRNGHPSHWALAFAMAVLWLGTTLFYGVATAHLGAGGAILGWPLFMSLIVIAPSLIGMFTGE